MARNMVMPTTDLFDERALRKESVELAAKFQGDELVLGAMAGNCDNGEVPCDLRANRREFFELSEKFQDSEAAMQEFEIAVRFVGLKDIWRIR